MATFVFHQEKGFLLDERKRNFSVLQEPQKGSTKKEAITR